MLDLNKYDTVKLADEGVEIELKSPKDDSSLNAFIRVCGSDSKVYRKAQMEAQNRRLHALQKRNGTKLNAEELEAEALEIIARCTLGWRGLGKGAEELPFSTEKARELYEAFPWIRKQVEEAINDTALFFDKGLKP